GLFGFITANTRPSGLGIANHLSADAGAVRKPRPVRKSQRVRPPEESCVPSALNATLYAMFVRPLRFERRLPVSVSQTIVSVSKPPVAIRFPSSLKLTIASPYAAKAPLF